MEGDDCQPAARFQGLYGLRENFLDSVQFLVDGDPQGLERAGGRMLGLAPAGGDGFDNGSQLTGCAQRAGPDDGMVDAPGSPFIPVAVD